MRKCDCETENNVGNDDEGWKEERVERRRRRRVEVALE